MAQNGTRASGPRCIALVGPFQSGKTTLLEAILARTGAIQRQGTIEAGNTVGDASKEARHHKMSVELSVASTTFMGDSYTFIDLSGLGRIRPRYAGGAACSRRRGRGLRARREESSAAPAHSARARRAEDSALSVPQQDRQGRCHHPRRAHGSCSRHRAASCCCGRSRPSPATSSPASSISRSNAPLSTRSTPPSEVVPLEGDVLDREKTARFSMLETLADHDDELMEQLLEDIQPPRDKVFDDLVQGTARRPGLSGADRLGHAHQRRAAADEGAAP